MAIDEITVIDAGRAPATWLESMAPLKSMRSQWKQVAPDSQIFVLVSASRVGSVTSAIRAARRRHMLRGILVENDVEADMLMRVLSAAKLQTRDSVLAYTDLTLPKRVLNAWRIGAQNELIANAAAVGDALLVTTCGFEDLVVGWHMIPALAKLPIEDRARFAVEQFGSYLHWPSHDVHLDVEALRIATDSTARLRATKALAKHNAQTGAAIRALRVKTGLQQRDIPGLSARQLRRVEKGEVQPRVATYDALAVAHGMTVDAYLNEIAQLSAVGKVASS